MQQVPNKNIIPFAYVVPVVASLAPNAQSASIITFDQDSTFTWVKSVYMVDLAAAAITDSTRVIPLIKVDFVDTSSGRALNSAALPMDSIAGYKASEPFICPFPRSFAPNSSLRVTYTNYSAATTYTNIFFVLHGYKNFL